MESKGKNLNVIPKWEEASAQSIRNMILKAIEVARSNYEMIKNEHGQITESEMDEWYLEGTETKAETIEKYRQDLHAAEKNLVFFDTLTTIHQGVLEIGERVAKLTSDLGEEIASVVE